MTTSASSTKVILLSFAAALGGFLFGFDSGVINGTVDALQQAFQSTAVGTGFNVASMALGCAVGAFFAGTLADRFGRRPVLLVTAILFMLSAWGSGIATSSEAFVLYRILGGLAVGAASVLVPAYISEIAPAAIRGRLISLQQLMIVLGLFAAFLSNYNIVQHAGSAAAEFWWGFSAWQWMFWIEILPAALFFLCLLFVPESPRYLVAAGKLPQAAAVLASLAPHDNAQAKVQDIQSTLSSEHKPSLRDVINQHTSKLHPIIWAGIMLAVLQQFTGINVVFYYGATLWQAAGFTENDALAVNVISGAVNISFTFLAIALVDKIGRKKLLLVGALGQAVMLAALAIIFSTADVTDAGQLQLAGQMGIVALLAANLYIAFFATTWGPIVWVMLGEMFPNQLRGAALGLCGILHWLSNFTISMSFPVLLAGVGLGAAYGIYAAFGVLAFLLVKKMLTETRGLTLEQISREQQ